MRAVLVEQPIPAERPAAPVAVAEAVQSRYEVAAQVLDKAVKAGARGPEVFYLLAMAHKRQGKVKEARDALREIKPPDSNVMLQMGLLSIQEGNLQQAEIELLKSFELCPTSYEACYNLLLTWLTIGNVDACYGLCGRAIELAENASPDDRRFLGVLRGLLAVCAGKAGPGRLDPALEEMTPADEQRLLRVIRSLGQLDTVHTLLKSLTDARPRSGAIREAFVEAVLVKAKEMIDRCAWADAEQLLRPLARAGGISRAAQAALLNLLGLCAAATQDFDGAVRHFQAALKGSGNDARLHQNLALCFEMQGNLAEADPHWNRFFDLLDRKVAAPADVPHYPDALAFEALTRLASKYSEKEKWSSALGYVQRAARLRPNDPDVTERLFHLYNHAKRPGEARRTLDQLRRLRPGDPQLDLYELDLIEVKGLNDIERLLTDIDVILKRYPNDARVQERAVSMVGNVIPLMGNLCDQLTDQMSKVIDQVRHLPNYQINWSAVREVMRDLLKEFQKLRRITGKCLPLVVNEDQKRIIRDLADHIDKKMEACRSMGA
jgi:tetratricopeptide (TPR) repeat protein